MLRLQSEDEEIGIIFYEMSLGDVGIIIDSDSDYLGTIVLKANSNLVVALNGAGYTWDVNADSITRVRILPKGTVLVVE